MLLLSTDTSGKHGSIALARAGDDEAQSVEVLEVVPLAGGTFSAQLVPQISGLLAKHGYGKLDIGAFVVASGPGSFTGLRVGLAAIKALAEVLQKPIVAISLLEAIALSSGVQGKVAAALDAGRGEVYIAEYEVSGGTARLLGQRILSGEESRTQLPGKKVVTPDAGWAQLAGASGCVSNFIDAGVIARLGWHKLRAGETVSPDQLDANYIRRSDAEIFAKVSS
jgi:tRNA threonylcarbamoyladenosine biosynthesis protein TsaB